MEALLTARRTKAGQEDAFRKQWRSGEQPIGLRNAYLLEDAEDSRETLGIGFWDTAEHLLAYRTSDAATQRTKRLRDLVERQRWQRPFAVFSIEDIKAGGSKLPLLLPLLLAGAGAGAFLVLKRRRQGQAEEPASPQEMPASREGPPTGMAPVPGTASATASGPSAV